MSSFSLSDNARESLRQITAYTEQNWGIKQRDKYLKALYDRFLYLAKNPKRGKSRDDLAQGLLSYAEASHVIYYFAKKKQIEIVDVLHSKMEPESWL